MAEEPASYRPNPKLKRIEHGFESLLFNSRWLMAPFYLGLAISLLVLLGKFVQCFGRSSCMRRLPRNPDVILGVPGLIDVSLTGNLILIVMFSGYANFVS
jgi:uncharacterized protein (TIGR00645 family)